MQVQYNSEKKQTMQNTAKQNYPGSVIFYNTRTTKRGWVTMSRSQDGAMWNYHSGVVVFWWACANSVLGPTKALYCV